MEGYKKEEGEYETEEEGRECAIGWVRGYYR